jgi:hypothetical protein
MGGQGIKGLTQMELIFFFLWASDCIERLNATVGIVLLLVWNLL